MKLTAPGRTWIVLAVLAAGPILHAQLVPPELDLTELSPEELGELSISAASKRSEPIFATPSAVSAVTSGEVGRFGFESIADALRLVPGVEVTQDSSYQWDIGVRGFVGFTSNKLLVLMDGRTVYSPFYGGVDWSEANMQIEDLDRIEVVRGPGATLWGANAVNGIINIISKDARDTEGGYISIREGTADGLDANLRYGGQIGQKTWYRVYLTDTDTRGAPSEADVNGDRYAFSQVRAGFRVDSDPNDQVHLTLQGEMTELKHYETTGDGTPVPVNNDEIRKPQNVLGRLHWADGSGNELTVQMYADASPDATSPGAYVVPGGVGSFGIADQGGDFDLDVTDRIKWGAAQDFLWGGGFRWTLIDLVDTNPAVLSVQNPRVVQRLYNLFFQDEITLVPNLLKLTAGSKFEHDEYIGWQALPSVRLALTPTPNDTWWAAASRAIRSPSSIERDVHVNYELIPPSAFTPPVLVALDGSSMFHQEDLDAYEVGWRHRWGNAFSVDLTAYDNDYSNLRNFLPVQTLSLQPFEVVEDLYATNSATARGYGVEASANWRVSGGWHVSASFTDERLVPHGLIDPQPFAPDYALPHEMGSVRTWFDLPGDLEVSVGAYGSTPLRTSEFGEPDTAGYVRCDAQLTWWVRTDLELNLGVQNAFDSGHIEASTVSFFPTTEIPRNVFGQVQWRY